MTKTRPQQQTRSTLLDLWRSVAIFLMVFFHFFFDLDVFQYVQIDFERDLFWWFLPRIIVFLFLTAVGVSLAIVHHKGFQPSKFWPRFFQISGFAVAISAMTYFMFPRNWIYFGTLHCIAISSLAGLFFVNKPKLSLALGLILLVPSFFGYSFPWFIMEHKSMDYIPFFPWFGWVLMGIYAFHQNWHMKFSPNFSQHKVIRFMGAHSLAIYVLHQPIMYGAIYGFYLISKS
ncbi:heparan-alpha-glucosaminide N-acetyltransferase [Halobacteriovorax sp. GB3]|uniref:heparan-alpha-glucosaminide N-acetyltransferase n=1 Tax=Halobacteriovorax sp. GB3 TaxID=2719615 RepID=UPI002360D5A7|nr:heparan-alpha-glucosaminide N-acetyltransferase [Halobacteriovorax sp. GB3]MDD0852359.1 heparan-alpha-glucosaminide N-acetyltransferase [Halobacteriovorax sp. GB3]